MEKLIEILRQFDVNRSQAIKDGKFINKSEQEKYEVIAECFKPCAENILCNGYFLVNGKYIIDLGAIELYYHEENGDIKDPIMYHTNDTGSFSQFFKGKELPYFKFGSFNLHEVGVDVTFEKDKDEITGEEKKYRASFLIRSYRVFEIKDVKELEKVDEILNNTQKPHFDPHSKHIFDDMFPNGVFIGKDDEYKIEWKNCSKSDGIENCKRINVAEYEKKEENEKKRYVKKLIEKEKYDALPDADKCDYKYKGKVNNKTWYYKKESRNWGFKRIGINEHK